MLSDREILVGPLAPQERRKFTLKHTLALNSCEAAVVKRLVERGYVLLPKSGASVRVREMLRNVGDRGGMVRFTPDEAQTFAAAIRLAVDNGYRRFAPAEVDTIERFFMRVETMIEVTLRNSVP